VKESEHDAHAINVDDLIIHLKALAKDELRTLLHSRMDEYRSYDPSDYAIILSHIDDHARDVHHAIQSLPE
jgi:hypothetical protein